ncbi:hypothetical protein B7494_g7188 [Chlorociboria aeruginascens]|nr:hypothetical protein B7494_g7188 [Chlorociboria aeruginascens]
MHRDIKPENFLLSNGVLKLSDFGFASKIDDRPTDTRGTPQFVPPEGYLRQVQSDKADIWGLALMMLWLVDGDKDDEITENGYVNIKAAFNYYARSFRNFPSERFGAYEPMIRKLMKYMGLGDHRHRFDANQCIAMIKGERVYYPPMSERNHEDIIKQAIAPATKIIKHIYEGSGTRGYSIRYVTFTDRHPSTTHSSTHGQSYIQLPQSSKGSTPQAYAVEPSLPRHKYT